MLKPSVLLLLKDHPSMLNPILLNFFLGRTLMNIHTHVDTHICTRTHTHTPQHAHTHTHTHTHMNIIIHSHVRRHIHTCLHTHTYTHTHTHTNIHTYVHSIIVYTICKHNSSPYPPQELMGITGIDGRHDYSKNFLICSVIYILLEERRMLQ